MLYASKKSNTDVTITKQKKSRKPYFRRLLGFLIIHFLFGCYREILNCAKSLKGAPLRHFYIKSFCLVTTVWHELRENFVESLNAFWLLRAKKAVI